MSRTDETAQCHRLRIAYLPRHDSRLKLLDSQEIQYEFKDLDESPELNDYVADLNGGKRVIPTIQIDNEILINPSESDLKKACQQAAAERP